MAQVAHLCRHPVKSAGYEQIESARLTPGRAFPFDREWAIAHEAARFDGQPEGWVPKMNFLRGWASPALMAITCRSDEAARRLTLSHPTAGSLTVAPDDPAQAAALVDWLRPLWPENRPGLSHLVHVADRPMTDVPDPWIAVLNLGSNRDLGRRMGLDLSIHRWRGNLWLDGMEPWSEFGLIGQELRLGDCVLRIEERITRCRATCANPETGLADAETLAALDAAFGHQDFGVYASVVSGGVVAVGDTVVLP
jgi:uncharacterized protein YcbX